MWIAIITGFVVIALAIWAFWPRRREVSDDGVRDARRRAGDSLDGVTFRIRPKN